MNKADFIAQYEGVRKLINIKLERLREARIAQIKAKVAFERDQENLGRTIRDLKMELATDPSIQNQPDPSTGKVNKEWSAWLIERAVEKSPDYIQAVGVFYSSQENYYSAEMELHQTGEELGAIKTEALLLGALLRYVSSPE